MRAVLDASLPAGLDVLEVVEAAGGTLADRLEASAWEVRLPGVAPEVAASAAAELMARPTVEVSRRTKNGDRVFDVRASLAALSVEAPDVAPDGSAPAARPPQVLEVRVRYSTWSCGTEPRSTSSRPFDPTM